MPCQVDTSYEDAKWFAAVTRHHEVIEKILEDLIGDRIRRLAAAERLLKERQRFADEYESIFSGLYNAEAIAKGKSKIINGA